MIAVQGRKSRFCDGLVRRDFLRIGGLGACGLGLPDLLRAQGTESAADSRTFGKAKRCILLYLWGGPPHQDTFDPKPDAPVEVRGEFRPIATNVPGIDVCDHLPLISRHADKYTIIRSLTHDDGDHIAVVHDMMTGNRYLRTDPIVTARRTDHPNYGAVLGKLKPRMNGLPEYVQLPCLLQSNSGKVIPGQNGGFLGKSHDPFRIDATSNYTALHDPGYTTFSPPNVGFREGLSITRLDDRRRLLQAVDHSFAKLTEGRKLDGLDGHYKQAFSMVTSPVARSAFDLGKEDADARERYGMNPFGQSVLLSRRLVEAGIPLVTVYWRNGRRRTDIGWDNHINNFPNLKNWQLPPTDMAFSALLEDLSQRGMLEDTLVVLMGEFGRSPQISADGGRQHWPYCYSVVMAGGGVRGGEVYGSSDRQAAYPHENPVSPIELGATIYHFLGIDVNTTLNDLAGRPHKVCKGTAIDGLI